MGANYGKDFFRGFDPQEWESTKLGERVPGPLTGQQLGPYSFQEMLGVGTFSSVYRAWHALLRNSRAIKVLRPDLNGNPDVVNQFGYEARVMAALDHPNIVKLHDAGFGATQEAPYVAHHYMVMEFVDGKALGAVFDASRRPSLDTALDIIQRITKGLDYAHQKEVLHNDLKPDNILIGRNGEVKITDFGSARKLDWTLLNRQHPTGSIRYAAPEILKGDPATKESDLFSLGAVSFELLTGEIPQVESYTNGLVQGTDIVNWRALDRMVFKNDVADFLQIQLSSAISNQLIIDPKLRTSKETLLDWDLKKILERNSINSFEKASRELAQDIYTILSSIPGGGFTVSLADVMLERAVSMFELTKSEDKEGIGKGLDFLQRAVKEAMEITSARVSLDLAVNQRLRKALKGKDYASLQIMAEALNLLGLDRNDRSTFIDP